MLFSEWLVRWKIGSSRQHETDLLCANFQRSRNGRALKNYSGSCSIRQQSTATKCSYTKVDILGKGNTCRLTLWYFKDWILCRFYMTFDIILPQSNNFFKVQQCKKHPSKNWYRYLIFSLQQLHKHTFCCSCCCCCCFMARPDNDHYIEQDNCCNCNMAAIKSSLPFLDEVGILKWKIITISQLKAIESSIVL